MKKCVYTFMSLCFACYTLSAQTSYQSMFTTKSRWEIFKSDATGSGLAQTQFVLKDTVVNDISYKIFMENGVDAPNQQYFIKENIAEKKVYLVENGVEILLYDFSLKKGDTFAIKDWVFEVVNIGTMATSEGERKCLELQPINKKWDNIKWVEGLGAMNAPLYYKGYGKLTESSVVTCFFRENTLVYSVSDWNCVLPNTTASKTMEQLSKSVKVFPNPFRQDFNVEIDNPSGGDVKIEIFTLTGVRFYEEVFANVTEKLSTSLGWNKDMFKGVLILTITTQGGKVSKRIIKE